MPRFCVLTRTVHFRPDRSKFKFLTIKYMRRIRFSIVCLAILAAVSCQDDSIEKISVDSDAQGEVSIALTAESRTYAKSTTESLPDVADFTIEIFKTDGNVRLYKDTYANTVGESIYLNVGDYEILAWYGDSLGVGFDAAHFAAAESFTVEQQVTTELALTAKLANVKVAVNFGENLVADYSEFYAVVRARESEDYELTFTSDETRAGYLPTGSITFELYAKEDDSWGVYSYDAGELAANDFVTFNVDTTPAEGKLVLNISIDTETELVEDEITVPYTYLASDSVPEVNYTGVSDVEVIEGVETASVEAVANIVAYGEIANCYLTVDSDYITTESTVQTASLSRMSVSESKIDLANIDDETAAVLNAAGITWMPNMAGKALSYVNFSGVPEYIASQHYNEDAPSTAFSLTIVDGNSNETIISDVFSVTSVAPTYSLNGPADETDIWGWKIVEQSITYDPETCNPDMIELQYYEPSTEEWVVVSGGTDDGNGTITYGTVSGLTAGTDYTFRGVYNGGSYAVENVISTEDPNQVGNAGMDEWQTLTWICKYLGITDETYYWWEPYAEDEEDPWWDVNSKISMSSSTTIGSSNIYYRCFPTIGYSIENSAGTSNEGDYSAMIAVVHLGTTNLTGSEYIGELFIGTADDDGAHESDGHSFETRPSKISFDYYYYSKDSETGSVEFKLSASDGTVISTFSDTAISDTDSGWATYTATLDYDYTNLKASEIYMSFKASTDSSPTTSGSTSREFGGTTYTICGGSFLRIDNIQLIYTDPDAE